MHKYGVILMLVVGIIFMAPALSAQPEFNRLDLETVVYPRAIVGADFDNDNDKDIVVVNHGLNVQTMGYHANNGNGTFANPTFITVTETSGGYAAFLDAADFDHDGNNDIVVGTYGPSGIVTIFYGDGNGVFTDSAIFSAGSAIAGIVSDDFNNDGWADVAAINSSSNSTLEICLNAQDGTLLPPTHTTISSHAMTVASADLNGDGFVDAITGGWQDKCFLVLLGKGDGTFWPYTRYNVPNYTYGLAFANLVGDSCLDVAVTVTDYQGGTGSSIRGVWVYRGLGNGTLELQTSIATAGNPLGLTTARLMGTPYLDLVVACADDNVMQIIPNNGDDTFGEPVSYETALEPFGVVAADLDNNSNMDLVITCRGTHYLNRFLNASDYVCFDSDYDGYGDPNRPENSCSPDNCPSTYNPDQADWDGDQVGDACVPTPTGENVTVQTTENVAITFDYINTEGTTSTILQGTGPMPELNYGVVPLGTAVYYYIATTAESVYGATICLNYDEASLVGPEDSLMLMHFETHLGQWVNIRTSIDTVTNVICGWTSTLSPFIMAEECCRGGLRGNVNCDHTGDITIGDVSTLIDHLFISRQALCCYTAANVNGSADNAITVGDASALIDYLFITNTPPAMCGEIR